MSTVSASHVPPGFRFHPTDEELVDYYLRKKVGTGNIDLTVIKDVDLYKIEPWDLQEICKIGSEEQEEWYFFSHKDKKYPTGSRTNRATKAGFWKATGRDKPIYCKHCLIGMRKTLVFYQGRAPNGHKSDWIMHEYRLETNQNATPKEEGWVVCRVFKKRMSTVVRMADHSLSPPCWYEDQVSFMSDMESPRRVNYHNTFHTYNISHNNNNDPFLQLPPLETPKIAQASASSYGQGHSGHLRPSSFINLEQIIPSQPLDSNQVTDWRVLDKFVASQLSQGDHAKDSTASLFSVSQHMNPCSDQQQIGEGSQYPSTSTSTSNSNTQTHMWK